MAAMGDTVPADGSVPVGDLTRLGGRWIRIVATPQADLRVYLTDVKMAGIRIMLVIARESGGDFHRYARMYGDLIDAVVAGNEPDAAPDSPSSWIMTPHEFVSLGRAVRSIFPEDVPVLTAGLVSGQPSWLNGLDLSWASGICVHPYGKTVAGFPHDGWGTGLLSDLLDGYAAFGKPLFISEIGLSTDEVSDDFQAEYLTRMADYLETRDDVPVWMWFAHHDHVPGFGLTRLDGSEKPSYRAFQQAARSAIDTGWPLPMRQPPRAAPPDPPDRKQRLLDLIEQLRAEVAAL